MKITYLSLAMIGLTAISAESKFQGVQTGVHVGMLTAQASSKEVRRDGIETGKQQFNTKGFGLGLHISYLQNLYNGIHIGSEFEFTHHSSSRSTIGRHDAASPMPLNYRFYTKDDFGLSFLAGYSVDSFMPYIKLGYGSTKFEVNYTRASTLLATKMHASRKTSRLNSFRFGVGMQASVMRCLLVGLEYNHRFVKSNIVHNADNIGTPTVSSARHVRVNPGNVSSIMAKVTYRFGM